VKLTTHLHVVMRLRMCGAISPLPQYVFMVWCLIKQMMAWYLVKYRDKFTFTIFRLFLNFSISRVDDRLSWFVSLCWIN